MSGNNRSDGRDDGAATRSRITPAQMAAVAPRRTGAGREMQVGLFVIGGFLAVVIALFLLTDPGTLRGRYHVSVVVPNAAGIRKGDPVQLQGVNIGRVRGFEIDPGRGVRVRLELADEYPVPQDSRVLLRSNGLLGGVVADIQPGRSGNMLDTGDELRPMATPPGLAETAESLGGRADTVLARAQQLLSPQLVGSVNTSAVEMQAMLAQLSALAGEQRREMNALSASLRRSAQGIEGAATRPELARAIARTDSITRQMDQASANLNQASTALAGVMGRIERGEGTLGKLSRDETLYNNLNQAARNISETSASAKALTEDIRANPKKYINVSVF